MKRKLFSILTLLLCLCSGAWASTVSDLATISADHTVYFTDIMSAANLVKGTLYDSNYLFSVTGNNYANNKGTDGTISKLYCCRVKSTSQDVLAFKVSGACSLVLYADRINDRTPYLNTEISDSGSGKVTGTKTVTSGNAGHASYTIPSAGTYYIIGTGDCFLAGLVFTFPSADAPTITKQPVSATYEKDDVATALSVTASASDGTLQYEWYSNTSESTEGASVVQAKSTTVTYTPSTSSVGTTYYYCKVYDDNGNTDSEFATVRVVNAIAPEITYSAPAVTITCAGAGTVYYTTDGSVPSSSNGTAYTAPFDLDNSCTVRAVAEKGGYSSDLVKYDCYVDQSSAANFLISTGNHSGTNSGSVWTSNDGNFTLSKPEGDFTWSNHIFPGMHGHKMDNNIVYTLQPTEDIKITSIKIVGRTWLNGTAATVAVSDAAPSSATWLAGETGNVSYILTKEFTISADYGEAVTVAPTGNQFGCFLEVYGVKRSGPADAETVYGTSVTWDFSTSAAKTAALNGASFTAGSDNSPSANTLYATDGSSTITYKAGSSDGFTNSGESYYIKANSSTKNNTRYFVLPITASGVLQLTATANYSTYKIRKAADASTAWDSTTDTGKTIAVSSGTPTNSVKISYDSDKPYLYIGFPDGKIYTQKVVWTPETDNITLTTTDNMAGWRAFYDASQGYTVDSNTKVYVATSKTNETVTLTPISGIPSGTPVILKTSADNHKMTLTKATVAAYDGDDNLLIYTTSPVENKYRLGYKSGEGNGVGFYPYSGTPTSGAVILDVSSGEARALTIVLEDEETTGISAALNDKGQNDKVVYDLQGRKVAQPKKGLYIINGRKFVIK